MRKHCWIGTSGWTYKHWEKGVFYPSDLRREAFLPYYAERYRTVELNTSFYHLPKELSVQHWYERAPSGFLFAVKLSRFITHRKRLHECKEALEVFFRVLNGLKDKRGPLLIQLTPAMKRDDDRLREFLEDLSATMDQHWRPAFEFRHKSWLDDAVYTLLDEYKAAVVIHDMPGSVTKEPNDADFVYVRRHGGTGRYAGKYTKGQLEADAERIEKVAQEEDGRVCLFQQRHSRLCP